METSIISVIVPVYNVAAYLRECVDSICAQTFDALEILLIDDGSTDGSREICEEYAQKDSRIRVVHQERQGVSAARNKGLDLATGSLIGFVDSDDWIEPDMYQVLYENLCAADADVSTCAHDRTQVPGVTEFPVVVRNQREAMLAVLNNHFISVYAWNKLYKKELFDHVRYPVGQQFEDSYIILDLLESVQRMVSTNEPKYHYRYRDDSISVKKYNKGEKDRIISAEKNLTLAKTKYPELLFPAKERYILAHYVCAKKILQSPRHMYSEELKNHCRALLKNWGFILRNRHLFRKIVVGLVTEAWARNARQQA